MFLRLQSMRKKLLYAVYAERNLYTCSSDGVDSIKRAIWRERLNRIVVLHVRPEPMNPCSGRRVWMQVSIISP